MPHVPPKSELMTVQELSDYLRVHPSTIYRLIRAKAIPGFKFVSDWRFNKDEIDAWLKNRPRTYKP